MSKLHAIKPRISVNLLVKLTRKTPLDLGGPWGGLPLYGALLAARVPPPMVPTVPRITSKTGLWVPWEPRPRGNPCWGTPPPDGPPNLGSIAGRSLPVFTDFY